MELHAIESAVDEQVADTTFSGVVLVRERGQTIFQGAYGMAQRNEALPNTLATRFATASGTKTFTAVAICQLVARGSLAFDTPLATCVGVPLPTFDPDVTIHQLLTHTSGIPDYFDEEVMDDYAALWHALPVYQMRTPDDFLQLIHDKPMKFPPGARFHYNNAGYVVLARVVEHVTGMAFPQYVTRHVFEAAGMRESGYFATDQLPPRTAYGYLEDTGGWRTNFFAVPIIGGGDGGAYVTADDIVAFWNSLLNHALLPRPITQAMLTPYVQADEGRKYGYGIWITELGNGGFRYTQSGVDPGVSFRSLCYPEQGIHIVVIGNTSEGAGSVARTLSQLAESAT